MLWSQRVRVNQSEIDYLSLLIMVKLQKLQNCHCSLSSLISLSTSLHILCVNPGTTPPHCLTVYQYIGELDQSKGPMMAEDEESIGSTNSQLVSRRSHRRLMSKDRHGSASFDDGPDASQMMMQMLESKVKSYSQQLKLEVRKRKKTEELAQAALTQNEGYKQQIDELNSQTVKAQRTNKQLNERVRKLESIVDDDRATIKHLKQRCKEMESERDETFALLTKIEGQHAAMVKKEKSKHKSEMEKLSAGFLQSLGADPGTDVAAVVKELRTNNVKLQQEVDQLASRLARKNQSLMEALSAVNEITMEDEKKEQYQMNQGVFESSCENIDSF